MSKFKIYHNIIAIVLLVFLGVSLVHADTFPLSETYLREHKDELIRQHEDFMVNRGFQITIDNLFHWTSENGQITDPVRALTEAGVVKILSMILYKYGEKTVFQYIDTLHSIMRLIELIPIIDHSASDFSSAVETESKRIGKLLDLLDQYHTSPSENLKNELLEIEVWEIGVYEDYFVHLPLLGDSPELTEWLTWKQVFTYRNSKRA